LLRAPKDSLRTAVYLPVALLRRRIRLGFGRG